MRERALHTRAGCKNIARELARGIERAFIRRLRMDKFFSEEAWLLSLEFDLKIFGIL